MLRWIFTLIFISTGLIALEANMFQQQAWNVYQQKEAKQRKATFTPTATPFTKGPTFTITPTPDASKFTPSPTVTITPGK